MGERRMDRPDEEIEALLRRQPRRMPSSALWERLAAERQQATPQRPSWSRRWVGVGALAAVAVTAALVSFMADQPTPPRPTPRPRETRKSNIVAASPGVTLPKETAQAVPAAEPRQRLQTVRSAEHAGGVRPAHRQSVGREAAIVAEAPGAESVEMPPGAVEVPDQRASGSVAPGEEGAESSYYLEVVRGNERSVLSGSVVRDEERGVTQITIACDSVSREQVHN